MRLDQELHHDGKLLTILSNNPSSLYSFIRSSRITANTSIEKLTVGDKVYQDNKVADGFYDALTSVKSIEESELVTNPAIAEHFSNYNLIIKMRKDNTRLKPISIELY